MSGDYVELASGRMFYANRGIVGISLDDDDQIYEGCDGEVLMQAYGVMDPDTGWTDAERRELAGMMVKHWREWGGLE